MTVWVLLFFTVTKGEVFIGTNTFSTKEKCQYRIEHMQPIHQMMCVETKLNK